MKFLKLCPNDHELFDMDYHLMFPLCEKKLDVTEREKILIMYGTQGREFWLKFILTLRYNYYRDHFIHELAPFSRFCVFNIIKSIEEAFINIHKKFLEDECDPLKLLKEISDFKKFEKKIVHSDFHNIKYFERVHLYLEFSENADYLIGRSDYFDKIDESALIKCTFAIRCYKRFYISLYNLLQRYKLAEEVSKELGHGVPQQYWQPFKVWNIQNFVPSFFDNYIALNYGKNLCDMLSIPNSIFDAFKNKEIEHFCSIYEWNDQKFGSINALPEYRECKDHKNCFQRILHENCKEPLSCYKCIFTCETILNDVRETKKFQSCLNLPLDITSFPGIVKGCKDVKIQVESTYSFSSKFIETPILTNSLVFKENNFKEELPSVLFTVPPEIRNSIYQKKCKIDVQKKLWRKWLNKQKNSTDDIFAQNAHALYREGCKYFLETSNIRHDFSLKNPNKLLYYLPFMNEFALPMANAKYGKSQKNMRSIGVGYDGFMTVASPLKKDGCILNDQSTSDSKLYSSAVLSYIVDSKINAQLKETDIKIPEDASSKVVSIDKLASDNTDYRDAEIATAFRNAIKMNPGNSVRENLTSAKFTTITNQKDLSEKTEPTKNTYNKLDSMSENLNDLRLEKEEEPNYLVDKFFSLIKSNPAILSEIDSKQRAAEELSIHSDAKPSQKTCSNCGKLELVKKSFKKCGQCKTQNFDPQCYYCSKECQAQDWKQRHREEHRARTMCEF